MSAWETLQNRVDLLEQEKKVAQLEADIRKIERTSFREDVKDRLFLREAQEQERAAEEARLNREKTTNDEMVSVVAALVREELKRQMPGMNGHAGCGENTGRQPGTGHPEHAAHPDRPELTAVFGGSVLRSRWRLPDGKLVVRGTGDRISGWTIRTITRSSVVLVRGSGRTQTVRTVEIGWTGDADAVSDR